MCGGVTRELLIRVGQLGARTDGGGQQLTLNWMVWVPPPAQRPLRVVLPSGTAALRALFSHLHLRISLAMHQTAPIYGWQSTKLRQCVAHVCRTAQWPV